METQKKKKKSENSVALDKLTRLKQLLPERCGALLDTLLLGPSGGYPSSIHMGAHVARIFSMLDYEYDWMRNRLRLGLETRVSDFTSSTKLAEGRQLSDFSYKEAPSAQSDTLWWYIEWLHLLLREIRFNTTQKDRSRFKDAGVYFLMLSMFYDLSLRVSDASKINVAFQKTGHLCPSLSNGTFLIARESGGRVVDGQLRGIDPSHSVDSDGSFMTGILSLRTLNPFLFNVLDVLREHDVLQYENTDKRDICIMLSHTPGWFQYYLTLLYNRVREKRIPARDIRELEPVARLSSGLLRACGIAGVTENFGETYAGNRNRLTLKDASGNYLWRRDVHRFRSCLELRVWTDFVSTLKDSGPGLRYGHQIPTVFKHA